MTNVDIRNLENFFPRNFSSNGPGPLNITLGSDMPITLLHLMLMSKVYVVNSDMKNVICMSDPNVMFKGPGPIKVNPDCLELTILKITGKIFLVI